MTLPRQFVPDSFYLLTRRCTQRQLLMRPDPITNQNFLYCLAVAAQRYRIDVILPSALSNHHHTTVYDRHGAIVEFVEHFHKLFARAQNCHRCRHENFWSSEPPSYLRLEGYEDVMSKLVYAATNPVKDGLVAHHGDWPGVNGLSDLLNRRVRRVHRPPFFRAEGTMPEYVDLALTIPPELGDAATVLTQLRALVDAEEERLAVERLRAGKSVLGPRAVLRQSWQSFPTSVQPTGALSPKVSARSYWARLEAIRRNRVFVNAYRAARALWLAGIDTVFPIGTYWLRRFANVPVAAA
jgi:putative transposase